MEELSRSPQSRSVEELYPSSLTRELASEFLRVSERSAVPERVLASWARLGDEPHRRRLVRHPIRL